MKIKSISNTDKHIVDEITEIHLKTFEGFFLTFMGRGFLKQMYMSYLYHKNSNILVAVENNEVIGFLAYSSDLSGLYKDMIKKRLVSFMWYSFGAFCRKPKVFMRLLRAFLKPREASRDEKYVELTSIGVNNDAKSKGVGSQLITALKKQIDMNEYEYITLETDAEENEIANHFYKKKRVRFISCV